MQAEFSAVKKSKAAVIYGKEPPQKSACLEVMERKRYDNATCVNMEVEEEEVSTDETTSEHLEEHS